jgi:organic hydroperoxide reductase OsmC/OhrA
MSHEHHYSSQIFWTGADQGPTRDYRTYSRDYVIKIPGKSDITGSADPTFRGSPDLHNPEDMLVAALSACHMLSYLALCARKNVVVIAYEDEAKGKMEMVDGVIRFSDVTLYPKVTISADSDPDRAHRQHTTAHSECFIANSVNFLVKNIPVIIQQN